MTRDVVSSFPCTSTLNHCYNERQLLHPSSARWSARGYRSFLRKLAVAVRLPGRRSRAVRRRVSVVERVLARIPAIHRIVSVETHSSALVNDRSEERRVG